MHPASLRASSSLVPLSPRPIPRPPYVNESSIHGRHSAYPLIGGGDTAPHQGTPLGPSPTQLPPIRTKDGWIHILYTHTHKGFASLSDLYKDATCTPCRNVSSAALLRPSQIKHYTYGSWQSDLDIQDCLEGIFKLLRLDPSISLMQQPEMDQMLRTGEASTRWTHPRHFSDRDGGHQIYIPTVCGV